MKKLVWEKNLKQSKDFKLELQKYSIKNDPTVILLFTYGGKETAFTGSYCADTQKTRFQNAMRESALLKVHYVSASDNLSENFHKKSSVKL